ncbi:amidohydrolase family protein, partial [Turicibacter sanguinis]
MKTLIKNAWILTMDKTLSTYPQGMLVIEDDKISYVGEYDSDIEKYVDEVIDASGGILIPGMINTHAHVSMIPFRSLGDD